MGMVVKQGFPSILMTLNFLWIAMTFLFSVVNPSTYSLETVLISTDPSLCLQRCLSVLYPKTNKTSLYAAIKSFLPFMSRTSEIIAYTHMFYLLNIHWPSWDCILTPPPLLYWNCSKLPSLLAYFLFSFH